jgi:hypothetical protein
VARGVSYHGEILEWLERALYHYVRVYTSSGEYAGCLVRYRAYRDVDGTLVFGCMILRTGGGAEILVVEAPAAIERYGPCLEDEGGGG